MFRIDTTTASPTLPAPDPVATQGYFTSGIAGLILPTNLSADWLNAVQEELVNVATMMGGALAKGTNDQIKAAIQAYVTASRTAATELAAGIIRIATPAEIAAMTAADVAVPPSGLAGLLSAAGANIFTADAQFTVPYDGMYRIICVGGGQGGDGGQGGTGGDNQSYLNWVATVDAQGRGAKLRNGVVVDVCAGGLGGPTSVSLGTTTLIRAQGGGNGVAGSRDYLWIDRAVDIDTRAVGGPSTSPPTGDTYDHPDGWIRNNNYGSNGGNGASTAFGQGGMGGEAVYTTLWTYGNGANATGYGASGGGGSGDSGNETGAYGIAGAPGHVLETLYPLTQGQVLDIVVGTGGTGYQRAYTLGGNGAPGLVIIARI